MLTADLNAKTGMIEENDKMCLECGHQFSRKSDLSRHMLIHTGVNPFKCFYCDFSARYKEGLQSHCVKQHEMDPEEFKLKAEKAFPHKPRGRPRKN